MSGGISRGHVTALAALGWLPAPAVLAHGPAGGSGPAWSLDPWVVFGIAAAAILYARGIGRLAGRSGYGRWPRVAFWSGLATLALALLSPLDTLSEALFSAHMVQHELLMIVAAPLLVAGRPLLPLLLGLSPRGRRWAVRVAHRSGLVRGVRWLGTPLAAFSLQAVVLWLWHAPALFQAAIDTVTVHRLQHTSFLFAALLFWWSLSERRAGTVHPAALLYLFATAVHSSLLAALLTFSDRSWYAGYEHGGGWPLSPLEDQQLGGLIMWVPGGMVYLAAGLLYLGELLRADLGRRLPKPEAPE